MHQGILHLNEVRLLILYLSYTESHSKRYRVKDFLSNLQTHPISIRPISVSDAPRLEALVAVRASYSLE